MESDTDSACQRQRRDSGLHLSTLWLSLVRRWTPRSLLETRIERTGVEAGHQSPALPWWQMRARCQRVEKISILVPFGIHVRVIKGWARSLKCGGSDPCSRAVDAAGTCRGAFTVAIERKPRDIAIASASGFRGSGKRGSSKGSRATETTDLPPEMNRCEIMVDVRKP